MNDASTVVPVPGSPGAHTTRDAGDSIEYVKQARRYATIKFLHQLIRDIDLIFYCELLVLYYMDCSTLKFLLRALPHWFNFTPKPDIIPPIPPGRRQYITSIFGTNLVCMLLHVAFRPPAAGEATRGYLHGGWFIDFVGHQSPVSKWRLLGLDILCLGIQLLMLTVMLEKNKVSLALDPESERNESRQDHDAEEAGILRAVGVSPEDIEMHSLSAHQESPPRNTSDDTFDDSEVLVRNSDHHLDRYYTGEHILASLDVVGTVKSQWKMRHSAVASATSSGFENAASIASRRFTVTFGRGRNAG